MRDGLTTNGCDDAMWACLMTDRMKRQFPAAWAPAGLGRRLGLARPQWQGRRAIFRRHSSQLHCTALHSLPAQQQQQQAPRATHCPSCSRHVLLVLVRLLLHVIPTSKMVCRIYTVSLQKGQWCCTPQVQPTSSDLCDFWQRCCWESTSENGDFLSHFS